MLVVYSGRDLKTRIDASMQDHLASIRRKAPVKRAPKAHVAALSGPRHSLGLAVSNTIGTQHHSSLTRKRCRFRSSANSIEIGSRYVNLRLSLRHSSWFDLFNSCVYPRRESKTNGHPRSKCCRFLNGPAGDLQNRRSTFTRWVPVRQRYTPQLPPTWSRSAKLRSPSCLGLLSITLAFDALS